MSTENALPTVEQVAAQFAGKSMNRPEFTKPAATSVPPTTESAAPEVPPPAAPTEAASTNTEATPVAAAPEAVSEPAPEAPPVEKPDAVSAKFAALSRREKEIRQKETAAAQATQQAEQRIAQLQQQLEQRLKEFEARETAIKTAKRPLDVLKAHGFKYEDATNDVLGGYKVPEPDPLDERFAPINEKLSKLDEIEKRVNDREAKLNQREEQQNYTTVVNTIKQTMAADTDRYEYISKMGDTAVDAIIQRMVSYYERTGGQLTYEAACDEVEDIYETEFVKPLLDTKKVQSRVGPKAPATTPQPTTPPKQPQASAPKTLSSEMISDGSVSLDVDKMSPRDAVKHLAKQLKFI